MSPQQRCVEMWGHKWGHIWGHVWGHVSATYLLIYMILKVYFILMFPFPHKKKGF